VTCSSLETALQASKVQDDLMASQLRVAHHLLHCEKVETQALSQQVGQSQTPTVMAASRRMQLQHHSMCLPLRSACECSCERS